MRTIHAAAALTIGAIACSPPAEAPPPDWSALFDGTGGDWVDLTHPFSSETLFWPTAEPFRLEIVTRGTTSGGWHYEANNLSTAEHAGTHLDAPIHFAEDGQTADEIPLRRLIGPAAVIDVTDRATPDYLVSIADLQGWEVNHGPLPSGAMVILRTGWGERWPDPVSYMGTDLLGDEGVAQLHFPGLASEAAQWLVDERDISAVGIDTPSIDFGQSTDFMTHRILGADNVVGFENVANLATLPEAGAFIVALPMKIEEGSGGPLRIVGFVPR